MVGWGDGAAGLALLRSWYSVPTRFATATLNKASRKAAQTRLIQCAGLARQGCRVGYMISGLRRW
jgi:hypothetical protein